MVGLGPWRPIDFSEEKPSAARATWFTADRDNLGEYQSPEASGAVKDQIGWCRRGRSQENCRKKRLWRRNPYATVDSYSTSPPDRCSSQQRRILDPSRERKQTSHWAKHRLGVWHTQWRNLFRSGPPHFAPTRSKSSEGSARLSPLMAVCALRSAHAKPSVALGLCS